MKQFLLTLKRYAPWLSLLLTMDAFSALLLWISDAKAFETLMGIILLASLIFLQPCGLYISKNSVNGRSFRRF